MLTLLLQVCSVLYLAMSSNGTLQGFFYHLFSIIYASLFFVVYFLVTFERLAKTFQFLKMIHSANSRSYFNLFSIYAVACDGLKQTFRNIKTVLILKR